MKRILMAVALVLSVVVLVAGVLPATAAKPANVITTSNGFPSGMHFNLNLHGALEPISFDDAGSTGNSAWIPLYDDAIIQYISNKKAAWTTLQVQDPNGFPENGEDVGQVQVLLPSKVEIETDTGTEIKTVESYRVYARSLGKPNNSKNGGQSYIAVGMAEVNQACNTDDPEATNCTIELGVIKGNDVYVPGGVPWEFYRFENQTAPKRGKSMGQEITPLFWWSGWIADPILNIQDPETTGIDDADIPTDALNILTEYRALASTTAPNLALNTDEEYEAYGSDAVLFNEIEEWLAFLADVWQWSQAYPGEVPDPCPSAAYPYPPVYCVEYNNEWIFNIAELVVADQEITNNGTKLFQIRFYPDLEE